MKYTNEDFVRTISAVEDQGGELLDETCAKDEITYEIEGKTKIEHTHGCENETLFEIPFDPNEPVKVPEIVTEDDPDRGTYIAPDGTERQVQCSKKDDEGNPIFVIVAHEGEADAGGSVATADTVKVCAVADNVGMWPRFRHAIQDPESK
jgi:hypothetical protein